MKRIKNIIGLLLAVSLVGCNRFNNNSVSPNVPSASFGGESNHDYTSSYSGSDENSGNSSGNDSNQEVVFTVTLNLNGGTIDGDSSPRYYQYGKGEEVNNLPTPKYGNGDYVFVGWFTKSGEKVDDSFKITENMDLYAHWAKSNVVINLDPNGGKVDLTSKEVKYGKVFSLPVAQKEGYVFRGWYDGERRITNERGLSLLPYDLVSDNPSLKARYIKENITLSFYYGNQLVKTKGYSLNDDFNSMITENFDSQEILWGWYSDDSYTKFVDSVDDLLINGDNTKVYAKKAENISISDGVLKNFDPNYSEKKLNLNHLFYKGQRITSIDTGSFENNSKIQDIVLPNSLKYIEANAFSGCLSLLQINIPSSVIYIGENIFSSEVDVACELEKEPSTWTSGWKNGGNIIWGAKSLGEYNNFKYFIDNDNNLSVYRYDGYHGSEKNSEDSIELTIPETIYGFEVKGIGHRNQELTFISMDDYKENHISKISLPDSITYIGAYAFGSYSGNYLSEINIPSSCEYIYRNAFQDCKSLTSIKFPISLKYIGEAAFWGTNIKELFLPKAIKEIYYAFNGTTIFTDAPSLPKGWEVWHPIYFNSTDIFGSENGFKFYQKLDGTISIYKYERTDTHDLEIPETIKGLPVSVIEENTFSNHSELFSIKLPKTIRVLNGSENLSPFLTVFAPSSIDELTVNSTFGGRLLCEPKSKPDKWKINEDKFSPIWNCNGKTGTYGDYDFAYHNDGSITLIRYSGKEANITIPTHLNNMSVKGVGSTFLNNDNKNPNETIITIKVPKEIKEVGYGALSGRNATIFFESDKKDVNYDAEYIIPTYYGVNPTDPGIYNGFRYYKNDKGTISIYGYDKENEDAEFVIPEKINGLNVTEICDGFFGDGGLDNRYSYNWKKKYFEANNYGDRHATSIVLPKTIERIGDHAFAFFRNLTTIVIPKSVTSIGSYVFYSEDYYYNYKNLNIYCESKSLPENWDANWSYRDYDQPNVEWGYEQNQ